MMQKVYPLARYLSNRSNRRAALIGLLALGLGTLGPAAPGQAASAGLVTQWTPYGQGYTPDAQTQKEGQTALRCVNTGSAQVAGAVHSMVLNQTKPQAVIVTGWSKALAVQGLADTDYSVYVDVTYTDGTSLWGQSTPFATGTHGWQQSRLLIQPTRPIRSLNVYALFRNHPGTVWFARFRVLPRSSAALFDGQPLAAPVLPAGLQGAWFVRDVTARTPLRRLVSGQTILGLRWRAAPSSANSPVLRGLLSNTIAAPRAVTLYYVERFTAPRPVWWNDIRHSEQASEPGEYANVTQISVGAVQELSLYPFGCVTGKNAGSALGLPPDMEPRVVRIMYNGAVHLLFLACDLGLAPAGDPAHHDRAAMAVARYPVDPRWGFRDAAARYYALFPAAFHRRARAEGIWIPFTDPATVSGMADFHFAYHEGDNSVVSDHQRGILSFHYVEPMTYWMTMPLSEPRTYAAALAQVKREAAGGAGIAAPVMQQAQAVLYSGSQDAGGRWNVAFRDTPWCHGAVWVLDPNPRLPHPPGTWTKAQLNQAGVPTSQKADQPDGEYLDSLEAWADVLDYRPQDLAATPTTLTFAADDRPVLPTWYSVYAGAEALSALLHRRGKLLMANTVPWRFSAFAPLLDVLGTETTMFSDSGAWQPEPDAIMNLRRTMADHKPYLLLLNTDFSKVSSAKIALYFQRCLFYGIFPSMFSADAATHPYWENPALYRRDRPLFQKYIPMIQRLSAAGWEPVTWARSDQPTVWVERYGTHDFTVLNSTTGPTDCHLKITLDRFFPSGVGPGKSLVIRDALTGRALAARQTGAVVTLPLHLRSSETQVLSLQLGTLTQMRRKKSP